MLHMSCIICGSWLCAQNRDCILLGPPAEGDAVQVRWTDGLIYGAKFVAAHSIPMFSVSSPSVFQKGPH